MKILIEVDITDNQLNELKTMGYDINYPVGVDVTLDYIDKVIYCNGKIKSESIK